MKRIQTACLAQTIRFFLKDDIDREEAVKLVKKEVEAYKLGLERRKVRFKIEAEETLPDGSVIIRLRRQYNEYPCGDYLA